MPCPACNWVNAAAVEPYRRRLYPKVSVLVAIVAAIGGLTALMMPTALAGKYGYQSNVPAAAAGLVVLATAAIAGTLLLVRLRLRQRLDPNATYPRPPAVPPGTPPALVEQRDPQSGRTLLVPVPRRAKVGGDRDDAGAVLRPGQIDLPPVCCLCLGTPTTAYRPPMAANDHSDMPVPLCDGCRRSLRGRWWRTFGVVFVASCAAVTGLFAVIPSTNPTGPWIVGGVFGAFVGLIAGVVLAGRAARPYRSATVDRTRGITRFAARNPGYTALVAERARARPMRSPSGSGSV